MLERAAACIYITNFSSLPSFQAIVITDLVALYCVERSEFYKGKKYDKVDNDYHESAAASKSLLSRVYDGIKGVFKQVLNFLLHYWKPMQREEYEMIDFSEISLIKEKIPLRAAAEVCI